MPYLKLPFPLGIQAHKISGSLSPLESTPKRRLDRFNRFLLGSWSCPVDTQTHVTMEHQNNRPHFCTPCMRCGLIIAIVVQLSLLLHCIYQKCWTHCQIPTPSYKEIGVSRKIRVLLSGTLSKTLDLEKILPRQGDLVVNKSRRRSSLFTTPTTVDASWLDAHNCYTSVDHNAVTPSLRLFGIC